MSLDITQLNSGLKGHEGFLQWLVRTVKPEITVELGCDEGFGFFNLAIPGIGKVFSIDDFSGPFHEGKGAQKKRLIQANLLPNMELIDSIFVEATPLFSEDEIDILEIDGGHSYDNVFEDFLCWSRFVPSGGIVLFHDLYSFPNGPGRFFAELEGPKFSFPHSHGLGVWTKP